MKRELCAVRHPTVRSLTATGFTLIELMIVVVIIGILAAIAYPSYTRQVIKSNRATAQAFLMDVANREKQYLLDAREYADTIAKLRLSVPAEVSSFYNVTIVAPVVSPPVFTVSAAPVAGKSQVNDGTLTINDTGTRLRSIGGVDHPW